MKLAGNTILITGGGSGIGRALAESFHRLGNRVVIAGRRKDRLIETTRLNPGMQFIELDIASHTNIARAAKELEQRFPRLNVIVNNAGIMHFDDASGVVEDELMESIITTNLMGPIRMTGALIEHLKRQPSATVVMVSSVLGFVPMASTATYSATKAAIHSYTQSLRFRLRNTPVSVLELIPPWVRTELLNSSEEPRAMPLDEFMRGTIKALANQSEEVMVERAKFLRSQAGATEAAFFTSFNAELEASSAT